MQKKHITLVRSFQSKFWKNNGFSIIEVLVVITIIGLIIPSLFAMFFSHLRAQSKVYLLQEVKKNGDHALDVMEYLIKTNAQSIHTGTPVSSGNETCAGAGTTYSSTMYFQDRNGGYFNFSLASDKIASASSVMSTVNLTTDKADVTSLAISCARTTLFSEPIVSISFTISQPGTSTRPDDTATMQYQTKVKLRP